MDKYDNVRTLPFPAIASALGIDLERYKHRKGKHGPELYGPCPICKPKHNTTAFSYADDGVWNCFAGGHSGKGAIDLIKALRGCGFQDAVNFLEVIRPLPKPEQRHNGTPVAVDGSPKPLEKDTWRKFQVPCPWLEERIADQAVRERYGVFCYSNPARKSVYSGRVMIPVKDQNGVLYGYLGRSIAPETDASPKYLFPKGLEKHRFLFGAAELRDQARLRLVYLVESPLCVMKYACMGLPAVAAYGWSVSEEQLQLLGQLCKGCIYLPDRNKHEEGSQVAGLLAQRLWVKYPALPAGVDDPEFLQKDQLLAI